MMRGLPLQAKTTDFIASMIKKKKKEEKKRKEKVMTELKTHFRRYEGQTYVSVFGNLYQIITSS